MLFSSRLSLGALLQWCRALKHGLDIGLPLPKIFRQQAKSGPTEARTLANQLADRLQAGESLAEVFKAERSRFPSLLVELVHIGEETGRLTETFVVLEDYFEMVRTNRKRLASALVWPIMVYISAVVIVAIMICVLGMIAPSGTKAFDPLGLGLLGPKGAGLFLLAAFTFSFIVTIFYFVVRENEAIRSPLEAFALRIPGLDSAFRAFALQRFCLALHMTSEAGLRVDRGLHLAFRATVNSAYAAHADRAAQQIRKGNEIASTLAPCGSRLFPDEFLDSVQIGETTGQLAEVMQKQAAHYREEAVRKMGVLTMLFGALVYGFVMLLVIIVIFRIVMSIGGVYQDAMNGL
jgi:type IV pilus assembly protein PilC